MQVSANTAVKSQLSTLPKSDQAHLNSVLINLDTAREKGDIRKIPNGDTLFEIRISSTLRALVRIKKEGDEVEILAIARPDQLEQYIKSTRHI
jgi:hypothetical protein